MISVIVPIYNEEKYLTECVESILNQTYSDIELILVDDGSDDNSIKIEEQFSKMDSRVKVLKQNHEGPFNARKIGLSVAKGEYITFADADDFIEKRSYEIAQDDIEAGIQCMAFGIQRYHSSEYIIKEKVNYRIGRYSKNQIIDEIYPTMIWDAEKDKWGLDPSLCTKIFRADILKKIYDTIGKIKYQYGEDSTVIYPYIMSVESLSIHEEIYYNHRQKKDGKVPPYIQDADYLNKLHELYIQLCNTVGNSTEMRKQIDLFYSFSAALNDWKYGYRHVDVLFPFDKVEKGQRVVIYGAGSYGKAFVKQLKRIDYCSDVFWVDKFACDNSKGIFPSDEIMNIEYDKIVIAISNVDIVKNVKNMLMDMGVEEKKIIIYTK